MSRLSLPCVKCGKPLVNVDEGVDNQPYCGLEFVAAGHYGSTLHDPIGDPPPRLEIIVNLCDTCTLRAIDDGVAQSRADDNSIVLSRHPVPGRERAWVLAQNEKQHGSAYGADVPVDYRALMLEAGWPVEYLDREEAEA